MSRATPQFTEAQAAETRRVTARYQAHDRVWARQLAEMQVQLDDVQGRHDTLLATHNNLIRENRTLQGHYTTWEHYARQLEAENASLRDACGLPPQPFSLQNPNNVGRAYGERQQNPRETRIENLQEPGGGLALNPRPPPPPEVLPAGHQVISRFFRSQARVGSVGNGGPAAAGIEGGGDMRKGWEVEVQKEKVEGDKMEVEVEEEKVKVKEEQVEEEHIETDKMDVDQVAAKTDEPEELGPAIKQEE